jgi:hypothetical protein
MAAQRRGDWPHQHRKQGLKGLYWLSPSRQASGLRQLLARGSITDERAGSALPQIDCAKSRVEGLQINTAWAGGGYGFRHQMQAKYKVTNNSDDLPPKP